MKTENRQQLLIVITIVVVAIFVGDKLIAEPLIAAWKNRSKAISSLQSDIRHGTSLIKSESWLRSTWTNMQANTLPNGVTAAEKALNVFQECAQESGVTLTGVAPQWRTGDTPDYRTLVCRVDAKGSLWVLSRFLFDIEKGPAALKVESVEISSTDNRGQELTMNLQVSGLVLNPQAR